MYGTAKRVTMTLSGTNEERWGLQAVHNVCVCAARLSRPTGIDKDRRGI